MKKSQVDVETASQSVKLFGYVFFLFLLRRNLHLFKKLMDRMDSMTGNGTFNKLLCTIFLAIPFEIIRFRKAFAKFLVAHNIRMAISCV